MNKISNITKVNGADAETLNTNLDENGANLDCIINLEDLKSNVSRSQKVITVSDDQASIKTKGTENDPKSISKQSATDSIDPKTSDAILKDTVIDDLEPNKNTVKGPKLISKESESVFDSVKKMPKQAVIHNKTDNNIIRNVIDLEADNAINLCENGTHLNGDVHLDANNTNSDVIVLDGNKKDSDCVIVLDGNKTDPENTIISDDDKMNKSTHQLSRLNVVIDLEKDTFCNKKSNSTGNRKKRNQYDELYKENPLLAELIEKCLNMENTDGMSRVINRGLLVIYRDVDDGYKKSDAIRKVLTRTMMQLEVEPDKKFSHLKNLCDELKSHRTKKRVPFITLEERYKEQPSSSIPAKRRVDAVIDLDDVIQQNPTMGSVKRRKKERRIHPIGKIYPPINLDDDSSSDVLINDDNNANNIILIPDENSNKENSKLKRKKTKKSTLKVKVVKRKKGSPRKRDLSAKRPRNVSSINVTRKNNMSNTNLDLNSIEPDSLLVVRSEVEVNMTESTQAQIDIIEARIAELKKRLDILEESEVVTNNALSPYVLGEQIKTSILKLYTQLCQLTDTEATKRHEVRLQVVPGHPEGPVRCLEEFLNDNIDEEGNPPFPDMQDVTQCVWDANTRYNMNWSRQQVLSEAHALFTQLGRTMQKRRQKREWKDLMAFVKQEAPDPADDDPALQARLLENTRIAKRNEDDLIERFVNMEHGIIPQGNSEMRLSMRQSESDQDSDLNTETDIHTSSDIRPPNRISTMPISDISSSIPNLSNGVVSTFECGSTLTVLGSHIVIQPTVNSTLIPNGPNSKATSNEIMIYSSKTSNLNKPQVDTTKVDNTLVNGANSTQNIIGPNNNITKPTNLARDSSIVQCLRYNDNDLANAATLAKEILGLVQSDPSNITDKQFNLSDTKRCDAFESSNPTVDKQNSETVSFQVFTHTTKHKSNVIQSNEHVQNAVSTEPNTPSHNVVEKEINVSEVTQDQSTEVVSTDAVKNEDDIIKPEPLDIPSLLEELGQGYTATIFDIEDPFLVIEISDSSESENEEE